MTGTRAGRLIRGWVLAAGMALVALGGGCERSGEQAPTDPAADSQQSEGPTDTYEVRGRIVAMPTAVSDLSIRHEHIPEFVNFEGENPVSDDGVRGMRSMTMPFPLEDESMLGGLGAGDKVSFTLVVDRGERRYWISRIETLPAETELDFGVKGDESP